LKLENNKLGKIRVISHTGSSVQYSISDITQNYLPEILSVVNEKTGYEVINKF